MINKVSFPDTFQNKYILFISNSILIINGSPTSMKKFKAIAVIQARMSSKRLPGKVMFGLSGKPMIWHIVERLRVSKNLEKIISIIH